MIKVQTILPLCVCFLRPVITPALNSFIMLVVSISVWMPRSFLSIKASAMALGMPPMPSWMQSPSLM